MNVVMQNSGVNSFRHSIRGCSNEREELKAQLSGDFVFLGYRRFDKITEKNMNLVQSTTIRRRQEMSCHVSKSMMIYFEYSVKTF